MLYDEYKRCSGYGRKKTVFTLLLGMSQPLIIIFGIAVVLSLALAYRLSKQIVKPLNELNLDNPLENTEYDELDPLPRRNCSIPLKAAGLLTGLGITAVIQIPMLAAARPAQIGMKECWRAAAFLVKIDFEEEANYNAR